VGLVAWTLIQLKTLTSMLGEFMSESFNAFELKHSLLLPGTSSRLFWFVLIFFATITLASILIHPESSNHLIYGQSDQTRNLSFYFNCDLVPGGESGSCYPSVTPVTTFDTEGRSKKISEIFSNFSDYENENGKKAMIFHAYLGEYVTFSQRDFSFKDFSFSFWFKPEPWFDTYAPIISDINAESNAGWLVNIEEGGKLVKFGVSNEEGKIISPEPLPLDPNKFVNIAGTFDGTTLRLYKNGSPISEIEFTGKYNPNSEGELRLGLNSYDNQDSLAGAIYGLRIFNGSLTAAEVRSIYNNNTFRSSQSGDLIGYWPFNGNLSDVSDNHNDAIQRSQAVSMAFAPDGRMFFTEKRTGEIRILENDTVLPTPFAKFAKLYFGDHEGLLGIVLDPDFKSNHLVYVYSTHLDNETGMPFNRVIRLVDNESKGTNATILIDKIPADEDGNYAGGALAFGPDKKLYITVGMDHRPLDAQNSTSFLGKVLRINTDGSIPSDNPIRNSTIYTLGHRSMFGIAFDPINRTGIITENGDTHFDEINLIKKGGNYGFPLEQFPSVASIANQSKFLAPIRAFERVISPTQAIFYNGLKFPEVHNKFVFGSYNDGNLRALKIYENKSGQAVKELVLEMPMEMPDNIAAVAQSPNGEIYFAGYNIYKLESISNESTLSTFPIRITTSLPTAIQGLNVTQEGDNINLSVTGSSSNGLKADEYFTLEIPKNLIGQKSIAAVNGCRDPPKSENLTTELVVTCFIKTHESSDGVIASIELASKSSESKTEPSTLTSNPVPKPLPNCITPRLQKSN